MREQIIATVEKEKIIAIVRGVEAEKCMKVADALYAGGIRLMEVTYDQKNPDSFQATADAIAAINNESTGILATAKAYTDEQIAGLPVATSEVLGLVKIDDSTIKMNESNQLYVAKVSTDILEQGSQTLVLNGGSATN